MLDLGYEDRASAGTSIHQNTNADRAGTPVKYSRRILKPDLLHHEAHEMHEMHEDFG
jgi:hypothetical protein